MKYEWWQPLFLAGDDGYAMCVVLGRTVGFRLHGLQKYPPQLCVVLGLCTVLFAEMLIRGMPLHVYVAILGMCYLLTHILRWIMTVWNKFEVGFTFPHVPGFC